MPAEPQSSPAEKGNGFVITIQWYGLLESDVLQRCDAVRPSCDACTTAGKDECSYDSPPLTECYFRRGGTRTLLREDKTVRHTKSAHESRISSALAQEPANSSSRVHSSTNLSLEIPYRDSTYPYLGSPTKSSFPLSSGDESEPYAFALSDISLNDLNMTLWDFR